MTGNGITSLLVVDDYEGWRSQVRTILQARSDWKIIAEACDGPDAVEKATELRPDIVLLDLGLPKLNGIKVAHIIRQRCPQSKIIFLTENRDTDIRSDAMSTGASGYILKVNAVHDLLEAIAGAFCDHKPAALLA